MQNRNRIVGVVLLATTCAASTCLADVIAMYGEPSRTSCGVPYASYPNLMAVYVFHYAPGGATGSRFSAPWQSCLIEIEYFGDDHPFPNTTGTSQTGATVLYDACLTGWIHVMTVYYLDYNGLGFPPCCQLPVLPHAGAVTGQVEAIDCADAAIVALGLPAIANPNETCPCDEPVGTEVGTWGRIKALYRDH